jgi:hypothetical protein
LAGKTLIVFSGFVGEGQTMHRFSWLVAIALLAGCSELAVFGGTPAVAGDYGSPNAAREAGGLQPLNTLADGAKEGSDNRAALPAMFAALEDLSKKPIADGKPASPTAQTPAKPAASVPAKAVQAPTTPRVQPQRKAPPEQQAGLRVRRSSGPAAKIEALRERIQHTPSLLRRRGFHRAA